MNIRLDRPLWTSAAVGLVLLLGCDSTRDGPLIEELPNGATRVRNMGPGAWETSDRWTLRELSRVGGYDTPDAESQFGSIVSLRTDALGRVFLLDRTTREVRVFDESGTHVRTIGGEGDGPGEFLNPFGMDFDPAGRLWVADGQTGRYTVLDTTGALMATHPRAIAGWGMPWGGAFGDDGRLYEPSYDSDPSQGESRHYVRHEVDETVRATDTLPLPFHIADYYRIDIPDNYRLFRVPFTQRLRWVFDGTAGLWSGLTGDYRIVHRTLAGDTLRIIEREFSPPQVTSTEIDEAFDSLDLPPEILRTIDRARIPSVRPAFSSFLIDGAAHLWVFRMDGDAGTEADVFDPQGVLLGTLPIEFGLFPPPVISMDRVYAIAPDDLGTPILAIYELRR